MDQQGKVKLFRILKVVFYCLGLPLMFMSVLAISVQFYGHAGFSGTSWLPNNILAKVTIPLSGTALYGVWIALGVWAFIGAMQILFHYVIKNRRARMVAVCIVTLVAMLVPVFVIDASLSSQIDDLAAMAKADGNGVQVEDYMTQLSYYRTVSSAGTPTGRMGNRTDAFNDRISQLCRDFNIGYGGGSSNGTAGSYNSNPITYAFLGIDINGDKKLDELDDIVIKVEPTGGNKKTPGKLVLKDFYMLKQDKDHMKKYQDAFRSMQDSSFTLPDGYFVESDFEHKDSMTFEGYMPVGRGKNDGYQDVKATLWYDEGKMPQPADGIFGKADYSRNGLLGDGYIFGLDIALNILETYYGSKVNIDDAIAKYNKLYPDNQIDFDSYRAELQKQAKIKQQEYYLENEDVEKHLQYLREMEYFKGDFELSPAKLTELLSELGGVIGTNFLFDKLAGLFEPTIANALNKGGTVGDILTNLVNGLKGVGDSPLGGLIGTVLPMLAGEDYLDTNEWYGLDETNGSIVETSTTVYDKRVELGWAGNGKFDFEPFNDTNGNGWCDDTETYTDEDGDGKWTHEPLNVTKTNNKITGMRIHRQETPRDIGLLGTVVGDGTLAHPGALAGIGLQDARLSLVYNKDLNGNGEWDEGEYFDENGDGKPNDYIPANPEAGTPEYLNEKFWGLRIVFKVNTASKGEYFLDENNNGKYDLGEKFTDSMGDGIWNEGEPFEDVNKNGKWDPADKYVDANHNGMWDDAEPLVDTNANGRWDEGETFTDLNGNGKWDPAEKFIDDINGNGKWDPAEPFTDYIDGVYNAPDPNPIYKGVVINLSTDLSAAHLSPLVDGILDVVCSLTGMPKSTIDSLLGLVGGLLPVDLKDLETSIMGILQGLYWYQSPDILPFFSEQFYVNEEDVELLQFIQREMSKYDAAEYAGSKHGTAISSELIAKSGEIGLNSLGAVQQVKMDMSYKPIMYPIMSARDMLLVFSGLAVFWMIISYTCAEKEYEYETGTAPLKVKKSKKDKKSSGKQNKKNSGKVVSKKEETKIPVEENNDKEVM